MENKNCSQKYKISSTLCCCSSLTERSIPFAVQPQGLIALSNGKYVWFKPTPIPVSFMIFLPILSSEAS